MQMNRPIEMPQGKKTYFASDFHLGIPSYEQSIAREKKIVAWLNSIENDAYAIFFMGDIFDFWFEYKTVVPRGYTRFLGKLSQLADAGISLYLFRGNHDIWAFDYLEKECGVMLFRKPIIQEINGVHFFLSHGDGLGKGEKGYKFIKGVFENRLCQMLFASIHPRWALQLGLHFSQRSKLANTLKNKEKKTEYSPSLIELINFSKEVVTKHPECKYFIYGHHHIIFNEQIQDGASMIILGDWLTLFSYAVFDGKSVEIKQFQ